MNKTEYHERWRLQVLATPRGMMTNMLFTKLVKDVRRIWQLYPNPSGSRILIFLTLVSLTELSLTGYDQNFVKNNKKESLHESKSLISEEHFLLPQDDALVKYANTLGHKKTVQRTTRNFTSGKTSSTQFLLPKNTYRNKAGLLNSKEASKTFIETHSYEKINFTPKVISQDQNSSSISNHGKTDMLPKIWNDADLESKYMSYKNPEQKKILEPHYPSFICKKQGIRYAYSPQTHSESSKRFIGSGYSTEKSKVIKMDDRNPSSKISLHNSTSESVGMKKDE